MAKKKRPDKDRGSGKKNKKSAKGAPGSVPTGDQSPQAVARLFLEQAEQADPAEQKALAEKALQIDPDLADAYLFLGRINPVRREVLAHYRQALAAAERTIGPEKLQQSAGQLGRHLEGRPVLESLQVLAHVLWSLGRRDEAIRYARELLRLETSDPFTARYTLAGWLPAQDRDFDAEQLIGEYPEDSTVWNYTRALLAFRKEGDTEKSRKLLKKALKSNKHVPAYLLQEELPDADEPEMYVPGSVEEAMQYSTSFTASWRATEGACDWVRQVGSKRKKATPEPTAEGPRSASRSAPARLPQHEGVWQVDCRLPSTWVQEEGEYVRPWFVLVNDVSSTLIVGTETLLAPPSPEEIWDIGACSMLEPLPLSRTRAGRPAEILYPASQPWQPLEAPFQEVGIRFQPSDSLEESSELLQNLAQQMGGEPEPGLLDVPGVTPDLVRGFYDAAASYFRKVPWRQVGYESAVEVRCSKFQSGPWYAVVMGQSGMTLGLSIYEDVNLLRQMWAEPASSEENARRTVATTVTFGPPVEAPIADLDAAQQHGWPVARADAYPHAFHKERGLSTRPPLAWELELLEACLRAVPDFIRRRPQDDTTPEEVTVTAGAGQLTMTLSWIEDEPPPEPEPRRRGRSRAPEREEGSEDLLELVQANWDAVREAYDDSDVDRPVILLDVEKEEIFAYPFEEFKNGLSPEGRSRLEVQYQQAMRKNQVVVFVMDPDNQRVVSFSLDLE